jgi:uncharacterized protein (DUF302 family)
LSQAIHILNDRRNDVNSPSSVLERRSQNAARSFYRRALIATTLQAGKPLQTPALWRVGVMDEAIRSTTIIAAVRLVMLMSALFMALVPMSAQSAESLQEKPIMIKQTIVVEHLRIESAKSFADVRAALERSVPRLDPGLVKALDDGDVERADREKKEGPELSIFQVRDHGAVLKIAGKARNALQYDIGNPVTASLMVRHQLAAALYPPIRVVLYESDAGHGVFEYDRPSTTFGQFAHEQVTAVARGLDAALERALLGAAE